MQKKKHGHNSRTSIWYFTSTGEWGFDNTYSRNNWWTSSVSRLRTHAKDPSWLIHQLAKENAIFEITYSSIIHQPARKDSRLRTNFDSGLRTHAREDSRLRTYAREITYSRSSKHLRIDITYSLRFEITYSREGGLEITYSREGESR